MSKKKKEHVYKPYPGSERFGDWSFGDDSNVIWHNTDEKLVPDADHTDPNPIANVPHARKDT